MTTATVLLFRHTSEGNKALTRLVESGIAHADIHVIGDLGPAAGQPNAEHHVTFDALHIPTAERELLMDTIRAGGAVLGVSGHPEQATQIREIAEHAGALKVFATTDQTPNPTHNS